MGKRTTTETELRNLIEVQKLSWIEVSKRLGIPASYLGTVGLVLGISPIKSKCNLYMLGWVQELADGARLTEIAAREGIGYQAAHHRLMRHGLPSSTRGAVNFMKAKV